MLIIDDDRQLGESFARALRGYDVVALDDARAALDRIRAGERFDFILCDVVMPGMTGLAFFEGLTEYAPEQAKLVVFMTGGGSEIEDPRVLVSRGNQVLHKPFGIQVLRGLVRERCGQG